QRRIYKNLISMLQQDSSEDLDFWALMYGVSDPTTSLLSVMNHTDNDHYETISIQTTSPKTKKPQKYETDNPTTIE
ncbi:unnamed protein product, partial [Rotaria sp. Silwood1]